MTRDSRADRPSLLVRLQCNLATKFPLPLMAMTRRYLRRCAVRETAPDTQRARQLLIDVSIIARHDAGTGIQRAVRSLSLELLTAPPPGFAVRFVHATRKRPYRYAHAYATALTGIVQTDVSDELDVRPGDLFIGLDLASRILPARRADLVALQLRGVRCAFVVYDLLPATHPAWFTKRSSNAFRKWLASLALHADALFCISGAVAQSTRAWFHTRYRLPAGVPSVDWFHLGANFNVHADDMAQSARAISPDEPVTLLMVGTIEPRKGHALALGALEILWARGVPVRLVVVGRKGWRADDVVERLHRCEQAGHPLTWLRDSDDAMLEQQYRSAHGVLMASEAEGFGLPLVEAARYGLPVLARNLPVFREIAGSHIEYFNAATAAELADELAGWTEKVRAGAAPDSRRIQPLTWRESAARFRELISALDRTAPLAH
ncbi:Glycosyl transferase, group 1 [Burkholderia cenocepacia]|uniref:glycosyltransferase family 4 protein n=1 Tax=Burkholderia cenocepacia TaxID=95486 RepID=UPI001A36CC64|nr:glycosyltransferase family 1 protein [Burkholderia cenocepacia]CAD9226540.1 Glycosyl transferase, group 1 [Burkholderia cenocepacia]